MKGTGQPGLCFKNREVFNMFLIDLQGFSGGGEG